MNFQLSQHSEEQALFSDYLVNFINDAVCCLGTDAHFIYVNEATCRLLGYSRQELLFMTLNNLIEGFQKEIWLEQWQEIKQQKFYSFNCLLRTKDEQILSVTIAIAYVKESDKEFCCALIRESQEGLVSQIKEEQTQININIEAEKFRELRARFFSTMCHQLRSFLNIISFSNSLLRRYVDVGTANKKLPYLDNIQTAVEQITDLLDKVLFLGKYELRQLKCEPKRADLDQLCRHLIAQMKPISESKKQVIEYISQGNCSSVWVDWELLNQVLTNLLSNALKYSPNGGTIEFNLLCEETKCSFKIKDGGIGIPVEDRRRIFEPFYRGSNINNTSGSGLGLAIVKNLVEVHGGQIQLESKVGIGTTFVVTIPYL